LALNSYQPSARRWRGISSFPIIWQVGTASAAPHLPMSPSFGYLAIRGR
jgi:hypothetical protein